MKLTKNEYCRLMSEAKSARAAAYAPYSRFSVGAALLCASGQIYRGFNIENSSYGATVCAERVAIYSAMAAGERNFLAIAVTGGKANAEACCETVPCGVCLQVISELCGADAEIVTETEDGEIKVYTLGELLPRRFTGAQLPGT